jgi:hypothetical protein
LSNPTHHNWLNNERLDMNMNKMGQLELAFSGHPGFNVVIRQPHRLSRAQWWFAQMRAVVDCALDWKPAPPPRPEQIWFPSTQGQAQA